MTEDQKKIKKYVNHLERRLRLPLEIKTRINEDIGTEIHLLLESGKTVDEALREIGDPDEAVERFNEEFSEYAVNKNPVRYVFLILAAAALVGTSICMFRDYLSQWDMENAAVSIIGGADGPTSIFIAGKIRGFESVGTLISLAGFVCGCIAAYFLCLYGKGKRLEKDIKCVILSGSGLLLSIVAPFLFLVFYRGGVMVWLLGAGGAGMMSAAGIILNFVTLVISVKRRKSEKNY